MLEESMSSISLILSSQTQHDAIEAIETLKFYYMFGVEKSQEGIK